MELRLAVETLEDAEMHVVALSVAALGLDKVVRAGHNLGLVAEHLDGLHSTQLAAGLLVGGVPDARDDFADAVVWLLHIAGSSAPRHGPRGCRKTKTSSGTRSRARQGGTEEHWPQGLRK
eukprot:CAMPEP_0177375702 /NCGR_PEP_ID=MMETSP0368-20130122/44836_1 /TAXON_ID=447022 ORGANISM="Scrippsiella hangoei-like, Strain SHHI-4" /NCGR_SAMPLE_ID=MMETSP0368 /ASSEMBLY_ACC=CAM_ASM_000363 /LENGTH=119 /DNA_ID=CAMNT_0018839391 /DNA_START=120 /DNA_END=476 /DNA_ORIENTATION=+